MRRAVRIVLDSRDSAGDAVFVALEVDQTIQALVVTALVSHRDVAVGVTTRMAFQFDHQALLGTLVGEAFARDVGHVSP